MSAASQFTWLLKDQGGDSRMLFARAPFGLGRCTSKGEILPLNAAMEKIVGDAAALSSPVLLASLVSGPNRNEYQDLLDELVSGKRESFQIESAMSSEARIQQWIVWRSGHGSSQELIVVAHETSKPQFQHRSGNTGLETAGRLVGSVAHDFNNWITGAILYCDLLLSTVDSSHPGHRYAQEIRNACLEATGFVRQLLSLTKPTANEARAVSLNDVAEGMRNMLIQLVGEDIQLIMQLDRKLGLIKIDPTQAQQVLLNLILNARDAMPEGGTITVSTSGCNVQPLRGKNRAFFPCALVTVEDNGTGMDAVTRAHLFEPFFTTKGANGTGLGLSTVHDIVTGAGGLMHVDSEVGKGSCVTVLLPVISEDPTPALPSNDLYPQTGEVLSSTKEES
jgi:two-component system cell cycle sensor histidine kinase/response regulator CckA